MVKRAVITGSSGTVGSPLQAALRARGIQIIPWDRSRIPIDDYYAMKAFLKDAQPDILYHLAVASQPTSVENEGWLVNYHWTGELAWLARQLDFRMIFTSTVMVWSDEAEGPLTPTYPPDSTKGGYGGYGRAKWQAEQRLFEQNPESIVARLGWQIGDGKGSNNMVDHLIRTQKREGRITASTKWKPSCSFLNDTASALVDLALYKRGTYLINSNLKWSYYDIVSALNRRHGDTWNVVPTHDFVFDQRMLDERITIPPLEDSLPELEGENTPG